MARAMGGVGAEPGREGRMYRLGGQSPGRVERDVGGGRQPVRTQTLKMRTKALAVRPQALPGGHRVHDARRRLCATECPDSV